MKVGLSPGRTSLFSPIRPGRQRTPLLACLVLWAVVAVDAEAQGVSGGGGWEFGLDPFPYVIPPPPKGCKHTINLIAITVTFPSGHPKCGKAAGDPHLNTFDGVSYDLQAAGEFVAIRSIDDDLAVQYRMEGLGRRSRVSYLTAVAARVGERRLVFNARPGAPVRIDGDAVDIPEGNMTFLTADRNALLVSKDGYTVVWPDGSNLHVALYGKYLNAYFLAAEERDGRLAGLLGDGDGDRANDFRTREGRPLDSPPAFNVLYDTFAESWRVRADESLFDYESGESTDTFTDRSVPAGPATLDDLPSADLARAEAACGAAGVTEPELLEECVIDVGFSGDDAFIASALDQQTPSELAMAGRREPASRVLEPIVSGLCRPEPEDAPSASHRADAARTGRYASALEQFSGGEVWTASGFRARHAPLAVGDHVIAARLERLAALDAETGEVVWETDGTSGRIAGRGLVAAGGAVFTSWAESLAAYDLEAGTECWRLPVGPATSATFSDGRLFVSVDEGETGYLAAVDAAAGSMLWRRDARNPAPANWLNPSEPTVGGGAVFAADGTDVLAVDERTGDLRWRATTGSSLSTGLAYADGVVYVPTRSRGLHALDAATGEVLWMWSEPGISLDDGLAVSDELVYVADQRHIHALDRTSGAEIWSIDGERNRRFRSPALAKDRLYTITHEGELVVIDAADGTTVSRLQISGPRTYGQSVPVPGRERLFFVLPNGTLNAYR